MANGRPRDDLRIDIQAGRPGIAPDVDALALRCAALLDDKLLELVLEQPRLSDHEVDCVGRLDEPTDDPLARR